MFWNSQEYSQGVSSFVCYYYSLEIYSWNKDFTPIALLCESTREVYQSSLDHYSILHE